MCHPEQLVLHKWHALVSTAGMQMDTRTRIREGSKTQHLDCRWILALHLVHLSKVSLLTAACKKLGQSGGRDWSAQKDCKLREKPQISLKRGYSPFLLK